MKRLFVFALLMLGLFACKAQTKGPALDSQSVDAIDEPAFLQYYNPLTLDNLAAFFDQWAGWSVQWANTHRNPICDSLYQLFVDYESPWDPEKHPIMALPAVVEMSSFDTISRDSYTCGDTLSTGRYVPHLPGLKIVYYITPAIHELLMEFAYPEKDWWNSDDNNERIDALGEYIDKPFGIYLDGYRFESKRHIYKVERQSTGTVLYYSYHGLSGGIHFKNDVTGEFELWLTWDL